MATMYGVQPDIPGFHYHDKRRRTDIHFPRGGHAAFVEASQAANRPGILQGGSVYGCAFSGGAEHDFFSFARFSRPRVPGLVRVLSAFVLVAWVAAKSAVLTGRELIRVLGRIARHPSQRESAWRWFKKKIGVSVWTRQWFTFAVARDVYSGASAAPMGRRRHAGGELPRVRTDGPRGQRPYQTWSGDRFGKGCPVDSRALRRRARGEPTGAMVSSPRQRGAEAALAATCEALRMRLRRLAVKAKLAGISDAQIEEHLALRHRERVRRLPS